MDNKVHFACYPDYQVLLVEFIHGWHYFLRMSSIQFSHVSYVELIHSHSGFLVIFSLSVCTIIIVALPKHPGLQILLCSHKTDMIVWHKAQQESQHRDLKSIIYIFFQWRWNEKHDHFNSCTAATSAKTIVIRFILHIMQLCLLPMQGDAADIPNPT